MKAYYGKDVESLKRLIRQGRQPIPRADPRSPRPLLYMPGWEGRLTEDELDALIAYLLSLSDLLPQPPPSPTQIPADLHADSR